MERRHLGMSARLLILFLTRGPASPRLPGAKKPIAPPCLSLPYRGDAISVLPPQEGPQRRRESPFLRSS